MGKEGRNERTPCRLPPAAPLPAGGKAGGGGCARGVKVPRKAESGAPAASPGLRGRKKPGPRRRGAAGLRRPHPPLPHPGGVGQGRRQLTQPAAGPPPPALFRRGGEGTTTTREWRAEPRLVAVRSPRAVKAGVIPPPFPRAGDPVRLWGAPGWGWGCERRGATFPPPPGAGLRRGYGWWWCFSQK